MLDLYLYLEWVLSGEESEFIGGHTGDGDEHSGGYMLGVQAGIELIESCGSGAEGLSNDKLFALRYFATFLGANSADSVFTSFGGLLDARNRFALSE